MKHLLLSLQKYLGMLRTAYLGRLVLLITDLSFATLTTIPNKKSANDSGICTIAIGNIGDRISF